MEDMIDKVARAIIADIKRQMGGGPIPGVPAAVDSWSARGDVGAIDTADLARAAITAMRVPPDNRPLTMGNILEKQHRADFAKTINIYVDWALSGGTHASLSHQEKGE